MILTYRHRYLDLTGRTGIVGVINVTPDSFVEASRKEGEEAVLQRARQFIADGADILEIGGESTGPTSVDVTVETELQRVIPAIRVMRNAFPSAWIAVDTVKAGVADAALKEGADMINDVSAGRSDPKMFSVLATAGCPVVLMFAKDPSPRTTIQPIEYGDVVAHIHAFLESRIEAAVSAGIRRECILVDPGLGHFVSANPDYSFEILRRLREFTDLGPVLVSPSRKSFLAGPKNLSAKDRLPATLDASELAVKNGAAFIRTHDVLETKKRLET